MTPQQAGEIAARYAFSGEARQHENLVAFLHSKNYHRGGFLSSSVRQAVSSDTAALLWFSLFSIHLHFVRPTAPPDIETSLTVRDVSGAAPIQTGPSLEELPDPADPRRSAGQPHMPEHDPQFARLNLPTIVKGAGILVGGRIASRVLGYAFTILAAKTVGLKGFGLYTLGLTILRAIAIDLPGGQSSPVVRYVSIYHAIGDGARVKGTIRVALQTTVLISVVSLTAFLLLSDYLAREIFHQPQLSSVITCLAFSIPLVRLSSVLLGATVGMQIMIYRTVTRDLLEPVVTLGVFLLLFLTGFRLQALIFAYLSAAIVVFVLSYYFFAKTFAHLFSSPFFPSGAAKDTRPISELKTISKFTLPLVIARIFTKLRRWGDILLLGFFMPVSQVGLYTILYKTVNALSEISASLIGVFAPMIGPAFEQGALSTLKRQLQIVSRWTFSLSFPLILFSLFHAKPILAVLGYQFLKGEYSLVILLLGFLCETTTAPTGQVLTMSGRSQITLVNTIGLGVVNLVLFLILIPRFGIEGASLAVAVSMLLLAIVRVIEGHTIFGIQPFTSSYLKPLIASGVALVTSLLIDQVLPANRYMFIGCSFAIFSSSYLATLVIMGLDPADRFILAKARDRFLPCKEGG